MTQNVLFVTGIEPLNSRARNLLASERRAHAARVSHERRKATKTAASKRPHFIRNANRQKACNSGCHTGHFNYSNASDTDIPGRISDRPCEFAFGTYDEAEDILQWTARGADGRRSPRSPSHMARCPPVLRQMSSDISVIFDHTYQKQSFYTWTTLLSQRTAKDGFYCKDMFLRLIPQRAMSSPGLQDMVLAHALAHDHRRANPKAGPQLSMIAGS